MSGLGLTLLTALVFVVGFITLLALLIVFLITKKKGILTAMLIVLAVTAIVVVLGAVRVNYQQKVFEEIDTGVEGDELTLLYHGPNGILGDYRLDCVIKQDGEVIENIGEIRAHAFTNVKYGFNFRSMAPGNAKVMMIKHDGSNFFKEVIIYDVNVASDGSITYEVLDCRLPSPPSRHGLAKTLQIEYAKEYGFTEEELSLMDGD